MSELVENKSRQRECKEILEEGLVELIGNHRDCALVDFPNYTNVGDSAIWLGEIHFLQKHNITIQYSCTVESFSENDLKKRLPKGVILINGGGNFGTLWPRHQNFREKIMAISGDYLIIQLPQSIYYASQKKLEATQNIIKNKNNFRLITRDHKSFKYAQENFECRNVLLPDAANFLLNDIIRNEPVVDILILARSDSEVSFDMAKLNSLRDTYTVKYTDWLVDNKTLITMLAKVVTQKQLKIFGGLKIWQKFQLIIFNAVAQERLVRGCDLLSLGKIVITDRLHAHVLCTLMGIPNVFLDNNYGKISNYCDTWKIENNKFRSAKTIEEAIVEANALLTT